PRVIAYIPLFVAAMLFWMIFEQAATTLSAFAKDRTELSIFGIGISPEFFQSVNPLSIILLAPVFAWIWIRTGDRPTTANKFAIGLALASVSFLFLAAASAVVGDGKAPAWVLVLVYVIQTLGELCLSPVGLAATTLLAPRAFRSQAMALWFLAPAAGQAITAQVVQVTEGASDTAYFGSIGAVTLVFALALFALAPWVTRHIRHADELEGAHTAGAWPAPAARGSAQPGRPPDGGQRGPAAPEPPRVAREGRREHGEHEHHEDVLVDDGVVRAGRERPLRQPQQDEQQTAAHRGRAQPDAQQEREAHAQQAEHEQPVGDGPGRRGERARERAPDAVLEVPLGGGGAGEPRALARRRVPEPQELVRERPEEDDGGADASEREGDAGGRARDDVVLRDGTGRGAAGYGRRAGRRGASGGRGHEVPPRVCGLRNGRRRGPAGCAARCRAVPLVVESRGGRRPCVPDHGGRGGSGGSTLTSGSRGHHVALLRLRRYRDDHEADASPAAVPGGVM